jgi:quercetin dioxygenase-like cupin family protein
MSDYTTLRAADAPDYTQGNDPGHRFLGYGGLGSDQVSMNVIVLEPGATHKVPGTGDDVGHSHSGIDEIYFVASGTVTVKAGDDEIELGPLDAIRLPPEIKRGTRNTSDDNATVIMLSKKMDDPQGQTDFHDGFWR